LAPPRIRSVDALPAEMAITEFAYLSEPSVIYGARK
jgi:hypothetical protein